MEFSKIGLGLGLGFVLNYVGMSQESLVIYLVLMSIDMATGVTASYFVEKKEVRSSTFLKGFIKKMMTLLLPFVVGISMKALGISQEILMYFVGMSISVMIAVEAYSIIANIYTIRTGERIAEIDATEKLIKLFLSIFQKRIESLEKEFSEKNK